MSDMPTVIDMTKQEGGVGGGGDDDRRGGDGGGDEKESKGDGGGGEKESQEDGDDGKGAPTAAPAVPPPIPHMASTLPPAPSSPPGPAPGATSATAILLDDDQPTTRHTMVNGQTPSHDGQHAGQGGGVHGTGDAGGVKVEGSGDVDMQEVQDGVMVEIKGEEGHHTENGGTTTSLTMQQQQKQQQGVIGGQVDGQDDTEEEEEYEEEEEEYQEEEEEEEEEYQEEEEEEEQGEAMEGEMTEGNQVEDNAIEEMKEEEEREEDNTNHSNAINDTQPPINTTHPTPTPSSNAPSAATTPTPLDKSLVAFDASLIGRRVRVYWPAEDAWFAGVIGNYRRTTGKHKVEYDDGDEQWERLREEQFEFLSTGGWVGGGGGGCTCVQWDMQSITAHTCMLYHLHHYPTHTTLHTHTAKHTAGRKRPHSHTTDQEQRTTTTATHKKSRLAPRSKEFDGQHDDGQHDDGRRQKKTHGGRARTHRHASTSTPNDDNDNNDNEWHAGSQSDASSSDGDGDTNTNTNNDNTATTTTTTNTNRRRAHHKRPRAMHPALRAATAATHPHHNTSKNDSGVSGGDHRAAGGVGAAGDGSQMGGPAGGPAAGGLTEDGGAGALMDDALFAQLESFVQVLESELPTVEVSTDQATTSAPAPWGPGLFYATPNPDAAGRVSVLLALPIKGAEPAVYRVVRPHTGLQVKFLTHKELHARCVLGWVGGGFGWCVWVVFFVYARCFWCVLSMLYVLSCYESAHTKCRHTHTYTYTKTKNKNKHTAMSNAPLSKSSNCGLTNGHVQVNKNPLMPTNHTEYTVRV